MINWLEKKLLRRILKTQCPDRICGSDNLKCYVVCLKSGRNEDLLYIDEINSKGFSGTHWNDQDDKNYPASVPFKLMCDVSIEIQRYIGFWYFTYPSVFQCVLDDWTYRNRFPIIRDEIAQFFFNRRELVFKERTKILEILVEKNIENPDEFYSDEILMNFIHGQRWSKHPDGLRKLKYVGLLLDSFNKSGELEVVNDNRQSFFTRYKLTGKALITLETYKREENRYNQTRNLTIALIFIGIIQAYIAYIKP